MSWSNSWMGKPAAIVRAIDAYSEKLAGQSKAEFDSVKEGIKAIVSANDESGIVHVQEDGHAYESNGARVSSCNVRIKNLGVLAE
jgi:hypothetical protein